jgi:hypothetical protein
MCCAAACDAIATWPVRSAAVVLHAATARVSPVSGGDALFALPEGQVVRMSDQYQGFTLVATDAGREGWVAQSDLAPVI